MFIKWQYPEAQTVSKSEAETKLTALVADQYRKLHMEIKKRELIGQDEILRFIDQEINRVLGLPPSVGTPQNQSGFVIVTQSAPREGVPSKSMFLVDRGRIRSSWWTDEVEDALVFDRQDAAENRRANFRHNNPRVITYAEALYLSEQNARVSA